MTYIDSALRRQSKSFDLLSLDEENTLFQEYKETGDIEARDTIFKAHMRLVISLASSLYTDSVNLEDLIQEGNIAMLDAIDKFDSENGARFSTFATFRIRYAIIAYKVANSRLMNIAKTKPKKKILFNLSNIKNKLGGVMTQEVADVAAAQLNVSAEEVWEMDALMRSTDFPIDVDSFTDDDELVRFDPAMTNFNDPSEILANLEHEYAMTYGVKEAFDNLDNDRQRNVIRTRWMSEDDDGKTFSELATEYGVSLQRIQQIEKQALKKMRVYIETN